MLAEEKTTKTTVAYHVGGGHCSCHQGVGSPQTKPGMLRGLFHLHEPPNCTGHTGCSMGDLQIYIRQRSLAFLLLIWCTTHLDSKAERTYL